MDVTLATDTYILVIDTDAYSGNFERQLAGYVTGVYDYERGHGEEEAAAAKQANPVITDSLAEKSMAVRHNEYGYVTNTIRSTPGRFNNGMGFHYDAGQENEARAKSIQSMKDYKAPEIAKCEQRIRDNNFEGSWTKEACERTIQSAKDAIARAGKNVSYPAYESVAMFFSEPLSDDEMVFVKQRAHEYAAAPMGKWATPPFTVRDIYMVKREVNSTETKL